MEIFQIQILLLYLEHAQYVAPLSFRDTSTHFVPLQLRKNHILWRLHIENRDLFKDLQLASLHSLAHRLVEWTPFWQEDIHLEHCVEVDHVKFRTMLDRIFYHIRVHII